MSTFGSWLFTTILLGLVCGCKRTPVPSASPSAIQSAQPSAEPTVLGPQQLEPFIAACAQHRSLISKEFGVDAIDFHFDFASSDPDSAYSPRCQGFSFPDGKTLFAFDTLDVAGAVVFNTAPMQIVTILPWSRTLMDQRQDEVVFDRTFFRLRRFPSGAWGGNGAGVRHPRRST